MNGLTARRVDALGCDDRFTPSTIIVPVDGADMGPRALPIARRWAERFEADLVVITVDGEHDRSDFPGCGDDVELPGTVWQSVGSASALVPAVVDIVGGHASSVVCVGTRARSPFVDVVGADIAQEVVRSVEVPVLLVGPHCRTESLDGPVVVAHDGLPGGDSVLHTACAWAAAIDVPSVLLHVHESPVEQLSDVIPTLCAARAQLGGASLEMLPSTFPAGAIREYVQEVDASLLALSTRGSTGTLTASTGRTATWIVRESPCPVLVSHPPAVCAR